jgi:aerotolerance regulator-like protein
MIEWLNPVALSGLLAITGPIVVHLLRRQRAERLAFPSLRFILPASTSSTRFRMPSDTVLLLLRVAVIGLAAMALAQPFVMSAARRNGWAARTSRAIVVDANVSTVREAKEAAAAVSQTETAVRITGSTLSDALLDAVDGLSALPPSRREIVVISDFRHGALTSVDIAAVPAPIGLRFIAIESPSLSEEFSGDITFGAAGVPARVQMIQMTRDATDVRLMTAAETSDGLRLETTPDRAEMLLRSVARAGAPAPARNEPITVAFAPGTRGQMKQGDALAAWMTRTVLRMRGDRMLIDAARAHVHRGEIPDLSGFVVARDAQDAPVVTAFQRGSELVLMVAAAPETFLSAATLQSALVARRGEPNWNNREVARIPSATLAAWTRVPGRVDLTDPRPRAPGDARWVWAVVLALLILEPLVRKQRHDAVRSSYADAA